jgi:hypothetical protein
MRHTRLYRQGVLEAKDFPAAQISDDLNEPDTVVWLDLCEPDQARPGGRLRRVQAAPYPGFGQHSGFVASVALLLVGLPGGLYLLFRRLDWL